MALIGFEGFDHAAVNTAGLDLTVKPFGAGIGPAGTGVWTFANYNNMAKNAGQLGGSQLSLNNTNAVATMTLGANYTSGFLGFRFLVGNATTSVTDIVRFYDGATIQCGVSINASGKLIFWRGTNATILATGSSTLVTASYYFIEISPTINGSTGAITININGVAEITATGLNTQNSANARFTAFALMGSGIAVSGFDDLYFCDATGGAPTNTFLGPLRVETLFPTAANATTWTPNASTNVSRVQETTNDGDTSYNSIAVTGADTFTHGSLATTPNTIFAVAITASMRKDDVGAQSGQTQLISNGTTQNGTSQSGVASTYQYLRDIYLTDPHTSSTWSGAAVNATDIGYNHV